MSELPLGEGGRGVSQEPGLEGRTRHLLQALPQPANEEISDRLYGGHKNYLLMRRYGIDAAGVMALLQQQGGRCAICGLEGPTHVDHARSSRSTHAPITRPKSR